jgi:hypothetical protein
MESASAPRALALAAAARATGPGAFAVDLSENYSIQGHPNGGYLQCVLAHCAREVAAAAGSTHHDATAVSASFVGSPRSGPAEVSATVRRVGKGASFVDLALTQGERLCVSALVTLGNLPADARYQADEAPDLTPLAQCPPTLMSEAVDVRRVLEVRLDPATTTWREGVASERGEVRGWIRLNDGAARGWDPWSLLFAADALPPATFALGSVGWVPTLQLSSYVRRVPVGEWLSARQWCVVVAGDLVDERCDLFDETGALVATASQLAMVRFPPGP